MYEQVMFMSDMSALASVGLRCRVCIYGRQPVHTDWEMAAITIQTPLQVGCLGESSCYLYTEFLPKVCLIVEAGQVVMAEASIFASRGGSHPNLSPMAALSFHYTYSVHLTERSCWSQKEEESQPWMGDMAALIALHGPCVFFHEIGPRVSAGTRASKWLVVFFRDRLLFRIQYSLQSQSHQSESFVQSQNDTDPPLHSLSCLDLHSAKGQSDRNGVRIGVNMCTL